MKIKLNYQIINHISESGGDFFVYNLMDVFKLFTK